MPDAYVLDSYALLAYFNSEPAGVEVRRLLKSKHSIRFRTLTHSGRLWRRS